MKKIKDFKVSQKRVLVRCDFNVPTDPKGNILDEFRIRTTIPTIEYLVKKRAKVILMSHFDRPRGKVIESLRLNKVQEKLMEYLDLSIMKAPDCIGREIEEFTKKEMMEGEILLLENLRFHKGEENKSMNFAKKLARLGDIYINDAFATCHRNHASIVLLAKILPSGAGLLLEKEINSLNKIIKNPKRPLVAIFGGDDPDFKAINRISKKADWILIGGLIPKFIQEKGIKLNHQKKTILPKTKEIKKDIDQKTLKIFKEKILKAKTIF